MVMAKNIIKKDDALEHEKLASVPQTCLPAYLLGGFGGRRNTRGSSIIGLGHV